ncbi:sortase domain-bontaining protein [Actinomadura luteofluorescens]|uniref:sortase domain-containing protein n=1 Tax=Actinomadura luteofluorescens TaxID=46163 RepID=UPI00362B6618
MTPTWNKSPQLSQAVHLRLHRPQAPIVNSGPLPFEHRRDPWRPHHRAAKESDPRDPSQSTRACPRRRRRGCVRPARGRVPGLPCLPRGPGDRRSADAVARRVPSGRTRHRGGPEARGAAPPRSAADRRPDIAHETGQEPGPDRRDAPAEPRAGGRWYRLGAAPGSRGAAVIIGHVDSARGPAVFYRLGELRPGDRASVLRADGRTAVFRVDSVERFGKARFPTRRVYSDPGYAAIRLITCGGRFDRATGHYVDNVIAFGHLVRTEGTR